MVVGLDFSLTAIRKCASRCKPSETMSLVVGDAIKLPFADRSFEIVLAFHILDHLIEEDRKKAVKEIDRVLFDRGRAIIRVFSTKDMRAGRGKEIESGTFLKGSGIICHFFNEEELADLISRMALDSISTRTTEKIFSGKRYRRIEMEGVFTKRGA